MLTFPAFLRLALGSAAVLGSPWLTRAGPPADIGAPCLTGPAKGTWDLPEPGSALGLVDGQLLDTAGSLLFTLTGALTEITSPCLSCREGELFGYLDDGVGLGPDFEVHGTWLVSQLSGQGMFQARILKPVGPALVPVGRMYGAVDDPPSFPNATGTFLARWGLCP